MEDEAPAAAPAPKAKKQRVAAVEAPAAEDVAPAATTTTTTALSVVELVGANQLDAAVRGAALEVARTHGAEADGGALTLAALEAKTVKRLQHAGCTQDKKELRELVRQHITVGWHDAAGCVALIL